MNIRENLNLFRATLKESKNPIALAYPSLLLLCAVIAFFFLLWFIFAPRINNALVDIVEIGKQIQATPDPLLNLQFDASMSSLFTILFWFIVTLYLLWCLFGGFIWKWFAKYLGHGSSSFLFSFCIVSGIFVLFVMILGLPLIRISFFFPSNGQLLILTILSSIVFIAMHFLHIAYVGLLLGRSGKKLLSTFRVGIMKLPMFLFTYVMIGSILILYEVLLRFMAMVNLHVYLVFAIFTFFPLIVLLELYRIRVSIQLWKEK